MLDGVGARPDGHPVCVGSEAMHRGVLVERMRFVDERVQLLLSQIAYVGLFLVGAAAARSAGLDNVATREQVLARELAQFPGSVCRVESPAIHGARLDKIQ